MTHHDLLDVPYEPNPFHVDPRRLKAQFRKAQAQCHPDSWASKSPKQLDLAHTLSSRINEAYQCLLDPLARAEYILKRNGVVMSETDQTDDMELLEKVMDANEAIAMMGPEDADQISELRSKNQDDMKRVSDVLEGLIREQRWQEAKGEAIRLRYLQGIERSYRKWQEEQT
ncbi:Iron-sulfur cluster co-chaperone protein HscB-like protein [Psilocybe cubensis]|nr:Iron-sulfur cluster co-chaperone protein HscB-like protein [Psilocybe cubensis]KAH9486930.1 Iron-sulfur cluster co-chaperone protein HscB-like protein [Psilocybe cubensis]